MINLISTQRKENMKKITIILLAIAVLFFMVSVSPAADTTIDTTIDSVTIAKTKNQNEYVRFIITEPRTLDGVEYDRSLPVMAFGETLVATAKTYSKGDSLKAIVSFRKLDDGRESYTVLQFIKE
jgi:hypothetical protein